MSKGEELIQKIERYLTVWSMDYGREDGRTAGVWKLRDISKPDSFSNS
jgi:hypothetical protein